MSSHAALQHKPPARPGKDDAAAPGFARRAEASGLKQTMQRLNARPSIVAQHGLAARLARPSPLQRSRNSSRWTHGLAQRGLHPAPVQRVAAPSAVVQCWLDPQLLAGRTQDNRTKALAKLALAYNANRKGKNRTTRINQLDALHVAILQWLDALDAPDQNVHANALWAKDLLNAVQVEHQQLVRASIGANDANPPVANFAALAPDVQKFVRHTWQTLVAGTGNVRITEAENYTHSATSAPTTRQHAGFRIEVLAQFARLLNTTTGRDIVRQVNASTNGQRLVTIKPGFAVAQGGGPAAEFAAGPATNNGADKLTEIDIATKLAPFKGTKNASKKRAAYLAKFVNLDLGAIHDPKAKAAAIYAARRANPGKIGIRMAGKYYLFGAGTAVDVTITRDIRDAEDHHTARFVDDQRNEIPTPNFITLGHELGHAAHMMGGVALGDDQVSSHLLGQVGVTGPEEANWSNMEEYGNIHSVENALRGDYGLKPRYGHINQAFVQKKRLDPIIGKLYDLSDLQPANQRGPSDQPLGRAVQALGALKINDVRREMAAAVTAFSNQMPLVFPQFTGGENAAIRQQLTPLNQRLRSAKADVLAAALQNATTAVTLVTNAKAAHVAPPPQARPSLFWRMLGY
jgi:hypothetical protein